MIAVLGGLDYIDTIFTDFVGALDGIIRNEKSRREALDGLGITLIDIY